MQELLNWTIDTIREEISSDLSWLEEKKFDWTPLVSKTLKKVFEKNYSVLIITDDEHQWFERYILDKINNKSRPLLPFYSFGNICSNKKDFKSQEDINLVKDMLDISFPNGFIFWYIGKTSHKNFILQRFYNESFSWLIGDIQQGAMSFRKDDKYIDIKLVQLYLLLDKTIDATLFADITLD
ncbi:MAG: hypothetical protein B1H07_04545 [Campylobacteraceae bacterium 4484_166]|nr:MAG: hypothetical protein B1H07_04545 [Campylobacteraceae bacterium 4484_166]